MENNCCQSVFHGRRHRYGLDLGVTWHLEIQLTWNFFNSFSNLAGIFFFNSLQNFVTHFSIVLSHSKKKQVHVIAIMTPSITT